MGVYSYCECGQGQSRPNTSELLYGRICHGCKECEKFSLEEKVDFLLENYIENEDKLKEKT